jgi:F1F0 ATPase subunit 2
MAMSEPLTLLLSGVDGALLGAIFFGGLWWTVRKAVVAKRPALWIFGSLLLRTGTALVGFHAFAGGHVDRLLLCLVGFGAARFLVTRATRPALKIAPAKAPGAGHAP